MLQKIFEDLQMFVMKNFWARETFVYRFSSMIRKFFCKIQIFVIFF